MVQSLQKRTCVPAQRRFVCGPARKWKTLLEPTHLWLESRARAVSVLVWRVSRSLHPRSDLFFVCGPSETVQSPVENKEARARHMIMVRVVLPLGW